MKKQEYNPFIGILRLAIKPVVVTAIISICILFIVINLAKILLTSDYFKVKYIEDNITSGQKIDLSYLKGKNIFEIDLEAQSAYIAENYPIYRKIRLARVLPNRIFVEFIRRKPVALVKLYRYFYVDQDQVLFDVNEQTESIQLPLILGLETKIFSAKSARQYNIKELTLALDIIKELKSNRDLKDYKVTVINVAKANSASFFLLIPLTSLDLPKPQISGIEIILGESNIKNKINILARLLPQIIKESANIEYIELRFKEPTIKFKNVK